jgi:hypothetical protein
MADQDMRPRGRDAPLTPQQREIVDPDSEVVDVAGQRIAPEPAGPALAAPVARGDPPAAAIPVVQRFEILFVDIAAPGQEQDRAAPAVPRRRPVDPSHFVPVGGAPAAFRRLARDRAPVEMRKSTGFAQSHKANSAKIRLVTFW